MDPQANKHTAAPATWRVLLALIAAGLLAGCGITNIMDIVKKVQSTNPGNQLRLAPNWPIEMKIEVGNAEVAWAKVQKTLDEQLRKSGASTSEDASGVPLIIPPSKSIEPVALGEQMKVDEPTKKDIAPIPIGIPLTSKTIEATVIRLRDTPAGQASFNFGPPIGLATLSSAKAAATALGVASSVGIPQPASLSKVERQEKDIGDVRSATLASGSLSIPITNDTAGTLTVELKLSDGDGQVLGSQTKVLGPRSADSIFIDLTGKTIKSPLITEATTSGNIPAGTKLDQIDPDNDKMQVGPTAVGMDASTAEVHLTAQQGKDPPPAIGYNTALAPVDQLFNVTQGISNSGIKKITSVEVASGALVLDINNGFGLDGDLTIEFKGIRNFTRTPTPPMFKQPDGTFVLQVNAKSQATASLDLTGAIIEPDAAGNVRAIVSPATLDTDSDRTHGSAPLGTHNYATVTKTDTLFGSVTLSALAFSRVTGTIDATRDIPASEVPIELPEAFAETGIQPARVSIKLVILNQSQIAGRITPAILGIKPDNSTVAVKLEGATAVSPREPFKGDFNGARAVNATESTIIEINERNSNIVEVLRAGAKTMRFGGVTRIFGTDISLTQNDVIAGRVETEIPLALIVDPFGVGTSRKAFDIKPASPLGIDQSTSDQIGKFVKGVGLDFRVENGWGLPLSIGLIFSEQDDPYALNAAAFTRTLALGSGPITLSTIDLNEDEAKKLATIKKLGIRISSPGTAGNVVVMHMSDKLKIRIAARIKVQVGPELINQTQGNK